MKTTEEEKKRRVRGEGSQRVHPVLSGLYHQEGAKGGRGKTRFGRFARYGNQTGQRGGRDRDNSRVENLKEVKRRGINSYSQLELWAKGGVCVSWEKNRGLTGNGEKKLAKTIAIGCENNLNPSGRSIHLRRNVVGGPLTANSKARYGRRGGRKKGRETTLRGRNGLILSRKKRAKATNRERCHRRTRSSFRSISKKYCVGGGRPQNIWGLWAQKGGQRKRRYT